MRSTLRYSPTTRGFYDTSLHGDAIPTDAISVTRRKHAELIAGRAQGRAILHDTNGALSLEPVRRATKADLLAAAITAVKAEARRRILAIASLERQANDNAALAIAVLDGADTPAVIAARARRAAIDAVRVASNTIEAALATWALATLARFDAAADSRWPDQDER